MDFEKLRQMIRRPLEMADEGLIMTDEALERFLKLNPVLEEVFWYVNSGVSKPITPTEFFEYWYSLTVDERREIVCYLGF